MRTLACLLKKPSEAYKAFNDRLRDACVVLRPNLAKLSLVGLQPKVDLLSDPDDDGPVLRAAVCPLAAGNDAEAIRTERHLLQVLQAAGEAEALAIDADPPLASLFLWPLEEPPLEDGQNPDEAPDDEDGPLADVASRPAVDAANDGRHAP